LLCARLSDARTRTPIACFSAITHCRVLRGESQTDEIDAPAASDGLDIGGFGHFVQSVTECIGGQSIQAIALKPVAITPEEIRDLYSSAHGRFYPLEHERRHLAD
jgi:hypothetical protein